MKKGFKMTKHGRMKRKGKSRKRILLDSGMNVGNIACILFQGHQGQYEMIILFIFCLKLVLLDPKLRI